VSRVLTSGDVPDPIDDYLDRLLAALPPGTPDARRLLAEAEDHLRDAVDDAVSHGVPPDDAAFAAIARFGPPRVVARTWRRSRVTTAMVVTRLARAGAALAVVGLLAVGASGALAAGMRAAAGPEFMANNLTRVPFSAERCATFRRLEPSATTCGQAAMLHHAHEMVIVRLGAGAVGLVGAAVFGGLTRRRRRQGHRRTDDVLPAPLVPAVAATAFGLGAAGFTLLGIDSAIGDTGPGQYLSAAVPAAIAAVAFGAVAIRRLVVGEGSGASATVGG
jgi:hypothetical protein